MLAPDTTLSRSDRIYGGLLFRLEVGDIATYDDLSKALGEQFTDAARTALQAAIIRMEKERGLVMTCIREVGYKVCHAREVLSLMEGRQKKAKRQIQRGRRTGERADVSSLPPEERMEHHTMVRLLKGIEAELNRTKRKVAVVEEKQSQQDVQMEALAARVAAIEEQQKD